MQVIHHATDPIQGPAPARDDCRHCAARPRCLPAGLEGAALDRFERLAARRLPVARHARLFSAGDACAEVYAIRGGEFKTECAVADGMRVTAFDMAGGLLGLDGLGTGNHGGDAVALTDCVVCALPYAGLLDAMRRQPALLARFHKLLGDDIARRRAMALVLGHARAPQRLATFLLALADRHGAPGAAPRTVHLAMSRDDIATYLGLTQESVSRLLSAFRDDGLLEVSKRVVTLRDEAGLREMAENGRTADEKKPA